MKTALAVAFGLAVLAAACGDPQPPPAPTPVAPTINETFNGTLNLKSTNTHIFNVHQIGGLVVTLANVDPSVPVALAIGHEVGSTCTIFKTVTTLAGNSAQLVGTATLTGTFCVTIGDIGDLLVPVNYTIRVVHS